MRRSWKVSGRSCTTQLLTVLEAWTTILDEEASLDAFYLDFQKAFDTVPHKCLLIKLRSCGVNGNIIRWIAHFLSDRRQLVTVNSEKSGWVPVISGTPQCVGPDAFHVLHK